MGDGGYPRWPVGCRGGSTIVVGEVALNCAHPVWRMGGISAVADEAAHCYMRKLFERCHGFTMLSFGGWVASPRWRTRPSSFSPLWQIGKWRISCFPYGMGGVLRGRGRSYFLLSALFVCEVPLIRHVVITLWVTRVIGVSSPRLRAMSTSAVAEKLA